MLLMYSNYYFNNIDTNIIMQNIEIVYLFCAKNPV